MNAVSSNTPQEYVSSAVQIFELTEALGSAEAALVVWKLRGWLLHNQAKNPHISYRDNRWWTFSSLETWCKRDFKWLTPRQLGTLMKKLEDRNVIVRRQYGAHGLKMAYWYSVNEEVLAALIAGTKQANACDDSVESSDKNVEYKQAVKQKQSLKTKTLKTKQQQPPAKTVVAVEPTRPPSEAESSEHSLNAEGHDTTAVKASMRNEQHHDERPFPKVPQKGFPALVDDLIRFGIAPYRAHPLVKQYPEADIRYVMACAQTARLDNPPGFVVAELQKGAAGVLGLRGIRKEWHALPAALDEERMAAIRRENARMEAEDAAELVMV